MRWSGVVAEGGSSGTDANPVAVVTDFAHRIGVHLPGWVLTVVAGLVALAALLSLVRPMVPGLKWLARNIRWLCQRPRGGPARRRRTRRRFAEHLANELRQLALQEEWRDDKYAELEAEVEIEQAQRWLRLPWRSTARRFELERVPSLSKALQRSRERRVLLEGEPGAGKSVALRHVAWLLARRAATHGDENTVVPIYVNLKDFRSGGAEVTAQHIHDFVIESLNRVNSRDVEEFLDEEFVQGMADGTWLFLFDSFDEIPDILGAVDSGPVVARYTDAILSFLGPLNECRGVIASRDFHAPRSAGLTRFRIVRLTEKQQRQLVRKADLPSGIERTVLEGLSVAGPELGAFVDNPMFLGLLCEHMRNGSAFPTSSHAVFEGYLGRRFSRDANRISRRFGITPEFLRAGAEDIAFAMTAVSSLGLSPVVGELRSAVAGLDRIAPSQFDKLLQALDYIKLGRLDDLRSAEVTSFTFAHRRFQEYFATCVVIRDFGRVPARTLLTNGRWRETAVTLLQTSPPEIAATMVAEAEALLRPMTTPAGQAGFAWPPGCLHVLGILAAGLSRRPDSVGAQLRATVDTLLTAAWESGQRLDRRRALTFALLASTEVGQQLLEDGFSSRNALLVETAFAQASQIRQPSATIQLGVRRTLITLSTRGKIVSDRLGIGARLKQFPERERLFALLRLIEFVPTIDLFLMFLLMVGVWRHVALFGLSAAGLFFFVASLRLISYYILFDLFSWSERPRLTMLWMFTLESTGDESISNLDTAMVAFVMSLPAAAVYGGAVYLLIGGWLGVVVGVIALWYALLLPLGMVVTIVLDENSSPAAWPLLPFVALRVGWRRAPGALSWARRHAVDLVTYSLKSIVSVTLVLASWTIVATMALGLTALVGSMLLGQYGATMRNVVIGVLVAITLFHAPHFLRDLRRTAEHRRLVNSMETFTSADLRRGVELSGSNSMLMSLVQSLRRNPARCAPDVPEVLAGIAATIERVSRDEQALSRELVDVVPELRRARPVYGRWHPVLRHFLVPVGRLRIKSISDGSLNEIARFVEEAGIVTTFAEPAEQRAVAAATID
jgi:hypothetical protein